MTQRVWYSSEENETLTENARTPVIAAALLTTTEAAEAPRRPPMRDERTEKVLHDSAGNR